MSALAKAGDAPLVSVIVPLYNKAPYIEETLTSIQNCAYQNKEVIVVEDCSTDGSDAIAERICIENKWTFIRHRENSGLSVSRNTGLAVASGDYIQFWDADDILSPDGLGNLVADIEEDGSDFATAVAVRGGTIPPVHEKADKTVRGTTFAAHPECISAPSSCFKLYRRKFLLENDLWFVPGLYMQDLELNLRAAPIARKITMTRHRLGEYRLVEDSWSRTFNEARVRSAAAIEERSRHFYAAKGLQQFELFRQRKVLSDALNRFFRRSIREYKALLAEGAGAGAKSIINWRFIELMCGAGARCPLGIRAMADETPHVALAWTSSIVGLVPWAPIFLKGRAPSPDFEKWFPENEILSEEVIYNLAHKFRTKAVPNVHLRQRRAL